MLANTANYKTGGKYWLQIDTLKCNVEILAKEPKKLQLKFATGTVEWVSTDRISPIPKDEKKILEHRPQLSCSPIQFHPLATKPSDKVEDEDIIDPIFTFKWFRTEVRNILKRRGIQATKDWTNTQVLEALKKALPATVTH